MFKTIILNPKGAVFEGLVKSIFMPGSEGEFEVMDFHKPMISLLKEGEIIIDWQKSLKISKGVMMVKDNQLIAMIEE